MRKFNNISGTHLKENPFTVPLGYFENMESSVTRKISEKSMRKHVSRYYYLTSAAALIIIFITIGVINNQISKDPAVASDIQDFATTFENAGINNGVENLSSEEIMEFLEHDGTDVVTLSLTD